MAELDEDELVEREQAEFALQQEQQQDWEAQQQRERLERIRQQSSPQNQAQKAQDTVKKARKWVKRYEKTAAVIEFLAATFPVWGPILGVLLVAMFVIIVLVAGCNQGGVSGSGVRLASKVAGVFGTDVCKDLAFNGGTSGGAGGGSSFADIVITSAYRPGAIVAGTSRLSAHGRGEAVDIALRNPTVPIRGSDPRIAQLVQIAKSAGFVPAAGDTLDEYTNPTEGASGGHIHIEFNLKQDGKTTYCDNAVANNPPTDLVSIPPSIPVDPGTSDPRLRPCMLSAVSAIFSASSTLSVPTP